MKTPMQGGPAPEKSSGAAPHNSQRKRRHRGGDYYGKDKLKRLKAHRDEMERRAKIASKLVEQCARKVAQAKAALEFAANELRSISVAAGGGVRKCAAHLTPREREVLELLIAGKTSNKEIAAALSLSVRTVEGYRHMVFSKMQVSSAAQLVHAVRGADPRELISIAQASN